MKDIEQLPVYVVIAEHVHIRPFYNYSLKFIKQVIQCDITDLDDIYRDVINPMSNKGLHIQVDMYLREPPSPFRNWKQIELEQLKEAQERDRQERINYLETHTLDDDRPGALPGD